MSQSIRQQTSAESDWKNILWREWRNSEDEEYANHLFSLVTSGPITWKVTLFIISLTTFLGIAAGFLLWLIFLLRAGLSMSELRNGSWPIKLAVFMLAGGGVGSFIGLLARIFLKQQFQWAKLFFRLQVGVFIGFVFGLLRGPFEGIFMGLFASLACVLLSKQRGLNRPNFDPIMMALTLGVIIGPAFGVMVGGAQAVISGLFFGLLASPFLVAFMLILGPEGKIAWFFYELYRIVSRYELAPTSLIEQLLPYNVRKLYFWWREQPKMAEVPLALKNATFLPEVHNSWAKSLRKLDQQKEQPASLNKLMTNLQNDNWEDRFAARYGLVLLGGEAVEPLLAITTTKNTFLSQTAVRLLKNIASETTAKRIEQVKHLCPHCLIYYDTCPIPLRRQPDLIFYGCRMCHQSREFVEGIDEVVAVLDVTWHEDQLRENSSLRVNWLARRTLFDFDRVEIIQANDEDVERFAVQVGNDTDPIRKPRYREMICTIGSDCQLSENTLRILGRMFGKVEHQMGVMHESIGS